MPAPVVTYWTGVWSPEREGLSGEVAALRRRLSPGSTVVSFSWGQRTSLVPKENVLRIAGKRWALFRMLAAALERRGAITHAFGAIDAWHFFRSLGRRPFVFTVALPGQPLDAALYQKVDRFVAETEPLAAALRAAGVRPDRISVIHPGVDLARFTSREPPEGPFTLVFASTPADAGEIAARGIPLLVEAARRCPDVRVVLLWRRWGNLDAAERALSALNLPSNVEVRYADVADMSVVFAASHATACLYQKGFGKSCPNSLLESLACGRPVLVTPACGIATEISTASAGVVTGDNADAVVDAIRRLQSDWRGYASRARALAESRFDSNLSAERYRHIYTELTAAE